MSVINGSDLYMWLDDELLAYSTSYTITIDMDARERTNKGTGTMRTYGPGLLDVSVSCNGLFVYAESADIIYDAMILRQPVTLEFGEKQTGTLLLDTTVQFYTGDFIITSWEQSAGDAENATYSASFKHSTGFARGVTTAAEFYWVSPTGTDGAGVDGSSDTPWATLAYACTRATTAGDVIHLTAGTFTETIQSVLSPGVSIIGAGDTSIVTTAAALSPMLLLSSAVEGTNGNQSISYVKFDGDLTAIHMASVRLRSNVIFDHVTLVDFLYVGIEYYGGAAFTTVPATYATGNIIRNSTITDCCSRRDPGIFGAIRIGGNTGFEVHDCVLTGTGRASTENGNLLYLWGATNKGLKFYNNTCTKPNTDGIEDGYAGGWNFHIESGNSSGFEVYDNTFVGGVAIDLAGGNQTKGTYDYSWWIHDNDFSLTAQIATPAAGTHPPHAIDYERTNEDVVVERNTFTNYPTAINITLDEDTYEKFNLFFFYNIFSNCGYSDGLYAFGGIQFVGAAAATGDLCNYIFVDNNVFISNGARGLIHLQSPYNLNNIYIRNNIFVGADSYGWLNAWDHLGDDATDTGTYNLFTIQNNIIYDCASANAIYYRGGKTITNLTTADNILADNPDFVGATDFHLQAGSPAINAGIDVGLTEDFDNQAVSDPPEIGAYEF